jgi:hypothetical protein
VQQCSSVAGMIGALRVGNVRSTSERLKRIAEELAGWSADGGLKNSVNRESLFGCPHVSQKSEKGGKRTFPFPDFFPFPPTPLSAAVRPHAPSVARWPLAAIAILLRPSLYSWSSLPGMLTPRTYVSNPCRRSCSLSLHFLSEHRMLMNFPHVLFLRFRSAVRQGRPYSSLVHGDWS